MGEQGYDPSVGLERDQAQGCDPMGIIEGPCGYSTRLVDTQGKNLFLRETVGESVPLGPRIGVFVASGSASLSETGT